MDAAKDSKVNLVKLDGIIKKTIDVINDSKYEIHDIAESARKECRKLEEELTQVKKEVAEIIGNVDIIETELKESKRRLMMVNKSHHKYSQEELRSAYEKADNLRIQLAVKREQEQFYIKRRNELEVRLKESYVTVKKADSLISNLGVALGYMNGDLMNFSSQIEDLQQKQFLGIKIIKAQEEERQRVARDIHDGPAQTMSNVVLKAELCERLIDTDMDRAKNEIQDLKSVVRECLNDVRKIIYNLRPMSLDDLGVIPTLQRYVFKIQEESGVNISFKYRGCFDDISSVVCLTTFRIIQEALSNIRKHSKAENAVVNLESSDTELKLYIYDDGEGFDTKAKNAFSQDSNSGFGLMSMKERIDLLNGRLLLNSSIGKGTRINIVIPLITEEENEYEND